PFIPIIYILDLKPYTPRRYIETQVIVKKLHSASHIDAALQSKQRMRAPERDQAAIVFIYIVMLGLHLPPDHIHRIRFVITVMIAAFRPQKLLSGMDKGDALRSEQYGGGKFIHCAPTGIGHHRILNGADQQSIPQRVVVMTFDVVDRFEWRIGEIVDCAAN